MKLYIVKYYSFDHLDLNDTVFFNRLNDCYYIGTDYKEAISTYKKCMRWKSNTTKFISIDIDKFEDCTVNENVKSEAGLAKTAAEYEQYIRGLSEVRNRLTKDGKITIVLNKDYFDSKDKHDKDPKAHPWTRFDIDRNIKLQVVKEVTDIWIRERSITTPFKVNCEGKTICQYNQK